MVAQMAVAWWEAGVSRVRAAVGQDAMASWSPVRSQKTARAAQRRRAVSASDASTAYERPARRLARSVVRRVSQGTWSRPRR